MSRTLPWEVASACEDIQCKLCITAEALEEPRLLSPEAMVQIAVMYETTWKPDRYLHLLLLYGGEGGAAIKMKEIGYCADSLDRINNPMEDILTIKGWLLTLYLVKCVVRHGTVWMSPECKTWLSFISRHIRSRIWYT